MKLEAILIRHQQKKSMATMREGKKEENEAKLKIALNSRMKSKHAKIIFI